MKNCLKKERNLSSKILILIKENSFESHIAGSMGNFFRCFPNIISEIEKIDLVRFKPPSSRQTQRIT